jgi:outer membrane protein
VTKHIFALPVLALPVLALPGLMLGLSLAAGAQTPNKVGVIQLRSALVGTKDGQKAAADLEARMDPKKKQLEKEQSDIRELQDQAQRGSNTLSDAARNDLARNIDQKTKSYKRAMEDAEAEFQEQQNKILQDLLAKMQPVIDKFAVANAYSIILDVSNQNSEVFYASNSIDITKDIVQLYDESSPVAPSATTPKPTPAAPKAAPAVKKEP